MISNVSISPNITISATESPIYYIINPYKGSERDSTCNYKVNPIKYNNKKQYNKDKVKQKRLISKQSRRINRK